MYIIVKNQQHTIMAPNHFIFYYLLIYNYLTLSIRVAKKATLQLCLFFAGKKAREHGVFMPGLLYRTFPAFIKAL